MTANWLEDLEPSRDAARVTQTVDSKQARNDLCWSQLIPGWLRYQPGPHQWAISMYELLSAINGPITLTNLRHKVTSIELLSCVCDVIRQYIGS